MHARMYVQFDPTTDNERAGVDALANYYYVVSCPTWMMVTCALDLAAIL